MRGSEKEKKKGKGKKKGEKGKEGGKGREKEGGRKEIKNIGKESFTGKEPQCEKIGLCLPPPQKKKTNNNNNNNILLHVIPVVAPK